MYLLQFNLKHHSTSTTLYRRNKAVILPGHVQADKHTTLQDKAEALALTIARVASARGNDPSAKTPWIQEAVRMVPEMLPWHKRLRPRGGKPDDSTAVVAFMEPDETQY